MFHRGRTTRTTRTTKPTLMTRLRGPNARTQTVKTTTKTEPVTSHRTNRRHGGMTTGTHHHKRKVTFGDKVSGAMLKMKGSITRRPGVKAAGTRRMHGTDGRRSHHHVY
ncbi:hypothetical protein N7493_006011 [Penicillium malachiteum]|uniref:Uncharacterized protein n=1 Tax=Penicillium malachiteum TaxID=1324776 RepID=A0AAD6HLG0_9EURO|nr:hypothetical protein N7493_006011 [Penicillium malachiteum]